MFRNLFILIAIITAIWIIRSLMNRPRINSSRKSNSKDMVQCDHCKTYLPVDDAIRLNDKNFCSQKHLQDWQNKSN